MAVWFADVGGRRTHVAGSYLFHVGDAPTTVALLVAGMVRIERTTTQGRRLLLDIAVPGDLIGELGAVDHSPRSTSACAVVESHSLVVSAREFHDRAAADPAFANLVLRRVVARLRELSDQLVEVAAGGAAGRVAARLLRLAEAAGTLDEPFDLPLPISQEELAQWAGLSREGTVKGLRELRADGILETGRRRMTILDPDALRARAAPTGR